MRFSQQTSTSNIRRQLRAEVSSCLTEDTLLLHYIDQLLSAPIFYERNKRNKATDSVG